MSQSLTHENSSPLASAAAPPASTTAPSAVPRTASRSLLHWLWESIPTFAVLTGLVAIGAWGHHTNWSMPKFSALVGSQVTDEAAWCEEHNVPEANCVECRPTLLSPVEDHGWCATHGVHQCPYCHPDVAQLATVPSVDAQWLERVSLALSTRDRKENASSCSLYRRRVQFTSHEAVLKVGVDVEPVETRPMLDAIVVNGEITYDETRVAHLSARVAGTVWRVEKNVGDRVERGDVLALIDSQEVGKAKSELLQSLSELELQQATHNRLQPLVEKSVVPAARLLETAAAMEQSRIRVRRAEQSLANLGLMVRGTDLESLAEMERAEYLRVLGLPDSLRAELADGMTNNLVPLVASLDGLVVRRDVVSGEVVSTDRMLFELADTSKMWLTCSVPLEEADNLRMEQAVEFRPDGSSHNVTGSVNWISTDVDRNSRTVAVRAELDNAEGRLRHETFGTGRLVLRHEPQAITVPSAAVHWDGNCFITFVRDKDYFASETSPKVFHARTVRPGVASEGYTEIIAGLLPGEVVVTQGSGVLRAQILRNDLGAGCTCGH